MRSTGIHTDSQSLRTGRMGSKQKHPPSETLELPISLYFFNVLWSGDELGGHQNSRFCNAWRFPGGMLETSLSIKKIRSLQHHNS